jgi:FtsP/CotA-like multicopper oxidase with cupredoxin domain
MSMMEHPMHLHGHGFELIAVDGVATSGIIKDTVTVRPMGGTVDVLLRANNPFGGRFLLHCHNEQHMDGGMATVVRYASSSAS